MLDIFEFIVNSIHEIQYIPLKEKMLLKNLYTNISEQISYLQQRQEAKFISESLSTAENTPIVSKNTI